MSDIPDGLSLGESRRLTGSKSVWLHWRGRRYEVDVPEDACMADGAAVLAFTVWDHDLKLRDEWSGTPSTVEVRFPDGAAWRSAAVLVEYGARAFRRSRVRFRVTGPIYITEALP